MHHDRGYELALSTAVAILNELDRVPDMAKHQRLALVVFSILRAMDGKRQPHKALALRLARRCRRVVQACLREEEWAEADREFYRIIRLGLKRAKSQSRFNDL